MKAINLLRAPAPTQLSHYLSTGAGSTWSRGHVCSYRGRPGVPYSSVSGAMESRSRRLAIRRSPSIRADHLGSDLGGREESQGHRGHVKNDPWWWEVPPSVSRRPGAPKRVKPLRGCPQMQRCRCWLRTLQLRVLDRCVGRSLPWRVFTSQCLSILIRPHHDHLCPGAVPSIRALMASNHPR